MNGLAFQSSTSTDSMLSLNKKDSPFFFDLPLKKSKALGVVAGDEISDRSEVAEKSWAKGSRNLGVQPENNEKFENLNRF